MGDPGGELGNRPSSIHPTVAPGPGALKGLQMTYSSLPPRRCRTNGFNASGGTALHRPSTGLPTYKTLGEPFCSDQGESPPALA